MAGGAEFGGEVEGLLVWDCVGAVDEVDGFSAEGEGVVEEELEGCVCVGGFGMRGWEVLEVWVDVGVVEV